MDTHPLTNDPKRWAIAGGSALFMAASQAILLMTYTGTPLLPALIDSVLTTALLVVMVYGAWYLMRFISYLQTRILLETIGLLVWIAGCFVVQNIIEWGLQNTYIPFLYTLPFRFLAGTLIGACVLLWYRVQMLQTQLRAKEEEPLPEEARRAGGEEQEMVHIDRITVKDGSRIHLIDTNKLLYLQACGDYVTLITAEGQYVKEQTMKYFEAHLPPALFVRVHRSYIVNVLQISRVELFGKENYQLLLKNGAKLRISLSGYKSLKEKLEL